MHGTEWTRSIADGVHRPWQKEPLQLLDKIFFGLHSLLFYPSQQRCLLKKASISIRSTNRKESRKEIKSMLFWYYAVGDNAADFQPINITHVNIAFIFLCNAFRLPVQVWELRAILTSVSSKAYFFLVLYTYVRFFITAYFLHRQCVRSGSNMNVVSMCKINDVRQVVTLKR